jgi:hypothetical protein
VPERGTFERSIETTCTPSESHPIPGKRNSHASEEGPCQFRASTDHDLLIASNTAISPSERAYDLCVPFKANNANNTNIQCHFKLDSTFLGVLVITEHAETLDFKI